MAMARFSDMPESCIAQIMALTTPKDVCRFAAVSRVCKLTASSDAVWEEMLPRNYGNILSRALHPLLFASKKDLYFRLCDPLLIDAGTKSVWVERSTGKICFMLSARDLTIAGGDDDRYWRWVPGHDSRFEELVELLEMRWLDVRGRIDCTDLSPNTVYTVSFVLKFEGHFHGRWIAPINITEKVVAGSVSVKEGGGEPAFAFVELFVRETEDNLWRSQFLLDGDMRLLLEGVMIEPSRG